MKASTLAALLMQNPNAEVYSECPETSGSWTISGVVMTDTGELIIEIKDCTGPNTPENYE